MLRNHIPIKAGMFASVTALAGLLGSASGADSKEAASGTKPSAEPKVRELIVSARPAPVPTLRYRFLPLESERTPGDAAPIYLRLGAEMVEEARRQLREKPIHWLEVPLDQLPVTEARTFVDTWANRLKQMEFGARRQSCDWNYTLPEEREQAFHILLPDAQEMRHTWAPLLALKARVEIAEHRNDDAIHTVETGLAFSRHLADAPFYINLMIGISTANQMLDRVEELISQPDAPNLYWALTALPRPLIAVRGTMETEQKVLEGIVPEITEPDRPRTEAEWTSLLARLHARMRDIETKYAPRESGANPYGPKLADLASFKAELVPKAKEYLRKRPLKGGLEIGTLSDDHAVVLYIAEKYRDIRDAWFSLQYLPYAEASAREADTVKSVYAEKSGPMKVFVSLLPAAMGVHFTEARLDRRIAALRIIEALRMHADANGGELPQSLDQVKIVPIPLDPVTSKPFVYHREGDAAVLVDSTSPPSRLGISYRITVRK